MGCETMPTVILEHEVPEGAFPLRRHDVRLQQLDGEGLVFDPLSSDTHHLNPTALFILLACDGASAPVEIAERMAGKFDVSAEDAKWHVARTIADLTRRGLIVVPTAVPSASVELLMQAGVKVPNK